MEWSAVMRHVRISPRKARLVADIVRDKQVGHALALLQFTKKRGAGIVRKVIQSAVANASQSSGVDADRLHIGSIQVDEGPTLKRWLPRAMGRATRVRKRTSHIAVALHEY
jgi:large subunit ribosomal protein L22